MLYLYRREWDRVYACILEEEKQEKKKKAVPDCRE